MPAHRYRTFLSHEAWASLVHAYSRPFVPARAWGKTIAIGSAWLRLDIESRYVPLPPGRARDVAGR